MRELRQDYLKKYVKAIFIFLVFMLGVILAFFYCIQMDVEHHVENMLMEQFEQLIVDEEKLNLDGFTAINIK